MKERDMRKLLLAALMLVATPAFAQVPPTMDPNTVLGRLAGPPGPPIAIPFTTLGPQLSITQLCAGAAGPNLFCATPAVGSGSASLRALVSGDIPTINLNTGGPGGVTGNLPVSNLAGGVGANAGSYWAGDGTWKPVGTAVIPSINPDNVFANVTSVIASPTGVALPICPAGNALTYYGPGTAAYPHSFQCVSTSGPGANPSTPLTGVQFNNSGAFGANSNMTWTGGLSGPGALVLGTPGTATGQIQLAGATSGTVTLAAPAVASGTLVMPAGGGPLAITLAAGTAAMATAAIPSATCAAAVNGTATVGTVANVLATDTLSVSFVGDPTAVVGYQPATTGMLTIVHWTSAGAVSFKVCNNTAASITPGALTLNWRVDR
jgi:hypothetical protein